MYKVSVIVPNYNHAPFLPQRLDSIFNQTFQNFEVILLDDCSADNSVDLLKHYAVHPQVSHFITNKQNSGSTFKQWNKGIELANGEYIWIAESDDSSETEFLREMVSILNNDKSLALAFCKSNWINDKNEICDDLSVYKKSFREKGLIEIKNKLVFGNTIQNVSSVLFRTEILKKVSKKYTQYLSCGDWILYTEILKYGDLYFSEHPLNNFRWFHNNISNFAAKNGLWNYEGIDVLKTAGKSVKFNKTEKEAILTSWVHRVKPFRISVSVSLIKRIEFYVKLFLFAPFVVIKIFFLKKWIK